MLTVRWVDKGQLLDRPCIIFGFDTVFQVMGGKPVIGYSTGPGTQAKHLNNLVLWGDFNPDELMRLVESGLNKEVFIKGDIRYGTCRKVYPFINTPVLPFRVGLTVHGGLGTWSSLPHRFEREEILSPRPMPFYEKFAYVTDPPGRWGVQLQIGHLFDPTGEKWENQAKIIRDRDILDIPLGSHPVIASPGTRLAYFWVYWGNLDLEMRREKFVRGEAV